MKIAITAVGTDLDSNIDERFGRARYFVVVDTDTDTVTDVIDNLENQHASHGAGVQAAQSVADKGIEWLLTDNVGPKAYQILNQAGIKIVSGASGTIREVVEKFKSGEFSETGGPTNQSHMP